MIPLEQIRIASPCHANWEDMTGDGQARFCGQCQKNVYNLSEMTRAEAEALVHEKEGRLCVRFYTRADGTVLTQDCPVGLHAMRVRLARKLSYAAALLLSCGTGLLRWAGTAQAVTPVKPHPSHSRPAHTTGKPTVPHKKLNPGVGPDPFALPSGPTRTMGRIGRPLGRGGVWLGGMPLPVMGAPVVVPPKTHGK